MPEGNEHALLRRYLRPNLVLVTRGHAAGAERWLRVLAVRGDSGEAALIDLRRANCFPFWAPLGDLRDQIESGKLAEIEDPMLPTLRTDQDLRPGESAETARRWTIIEPVVAGPGRDDLADRARRRAVADRILALKATNDERFAKLGPDKVLSYLRLYWCYGQTRSALVPAYSQRGAPGRARLAPPDAPKRGRPRQGVKRHGIVGVNVTAEVLEAIDTGYRLFKAQGMSDRQAWRKTLERFYGQETIINGLPAILPPPTSEEFSLGQWRYHMRKLRDPVTRFRTERGDILFAQTARPRLGSTGDMASGPGSVYQIDATIGDIYLRCADDPDIYVGRPVIYLVLDMYSRMIVGFFVALAGPSWEIARMALENAFSDKVEFYASLGIWIDPAEAPAIGVCKGLMGDRGWDHLSKAAGAAAEALGYKLSNLPPFRPDLKGLGEGAFDVANEEMIRWAPGAWRKRQPGEKANPLDGAYTLHEFTKFLAIQILKYNNTHEVLRPPLDWDASKGRAPTPVMLWNHGGEMHGAPEIKDVNWLRANLMPTGQAHETKGGLRFRGVRFVPPDERKDLHVRHAAVPGRKWRDVEIRWHPGSTAAILVPCDRGEGFVVYARHPDDRRFENMTFDEVDEYHSLQRQNRLQAQDGLNRAKAKYDAQIADLNRAAQDAGLDDVRRTRRPHASKAARAAEAREMRVGTPLPGFPPPAPAPQPAPAPVRAPAGAASSPPVRLTLVQSTAAPPRAAPAVSRPGKLALLQARREAGSPNTSEGEA